MSYCYTCNQQLSTNVKYCPHCGNPTKIPPRNPENHARVSQKKELETQVTTGMVLIAVAFFLPVPIVDIILAAVGWSMTSKGKSDPSIRNYSLTTVGSWLGPIAIIYCVISWTFLLALL